MAGRVASSSTYVGSGGGSSSATCTDLASVVATTGQIVKAVSTSTKADGSSGGVSDPMTFKLLKGYYNKLAGLGTKIGLEVPAAIAADAKKFASSINALNGAVKSSSSAAQVQAKVNSNAALKAATSTVSSSVNSLVKWRTANC